MVSENKKISNYSINWANDKLNVTKYVSIPNIFFKRVDFNVDTKI